MARVHFPLRSVWLRYGVAVVACAAAFALTIGLHNRLVPPVPFAVFAAAVTTAAWLGGFGPGLLVALAGTVSSGFLVRDSDPITLAPSLVLLGLASAVGYLAGERRDSDAALKASEARLRFALEGAQLGDWEWHVDSGVLHMPPRTRELLALPPDEATVTLADYEARIHPDDWARVREAMQRTIRDRSDYDVEYRVQPLDGDDRWVAVKARATSTEPRQPLRLVGVVSDITERRAEEKALRESERLYRAIGESTLYGVWVCDRQGRSTYLSESFLNLIGQTPREALGLGWMSALHPEERDETIAAWKACVAVEQPRWDRELRLRGADGRYHPVLARGTPVRDESGQVVCWAGLHLDIAHLKRAQDEAQQGEERFRLLADTAPVLIWMSGRDKLCTFFNRPWLEFTGRTMDQELGNGWAAGVHPEDLDRLLGVYTSNFDGRRAFSADYRLRRHDGSYRWILDHGVPLHDGAGEFTGYIGGCIDITDIKQAEAEREALLARERVARNEAEQANRVKDEFLATVSHELRTPLNAILGWASILRKQVTDPARLTEGLTVIERNSRMQARIIDDLLDVSRVIAGKVRLDVQRLELSPVIEAVMESLRPAADAKGLLVHPVIDQQAGPIKGDPNRMQQVVWNLVSNAIKFTPRGGRVQISLERLESRIVITVTDTGQGIPPEFLPFIFERFRQADSSATRTHGGLGIGLAIVKHLVEMHGGTVQAQSAGINQGATFTVMLPVASLQEQGDFQLREPRAAMFESADLCEPPVLTGIRVLVVDDDPDSRKLVEEVLTGAQADVRTAASADDGIEVWRTWQPTVILSDIGMPERDGYEFIRHIRALEAGRPPTPAAALTAFARSEDRRRALLSGYQTHVGKPVEPAELIAVVASLAGLTSRSAPQIA